MPLNITATRQLSTDKKESEKVTMKHSILTLALPLLAPLALHAADVPSAGKPNVLFIMTDMQRAYSMGCYGDKNARTPNLDAFATQGARFDASISTTPVCCPFRANLMSGLYSHHNQVLDNGMSFKPTAPCLGETFKKAGYEMGYLGKWHISGEALPDPNLGFPESGTEYGNYSTGFGRDTKSAANMAIKFIREKSPEGKPWFLVVSWLKPHTPYKALPGYAEHFSNITLPPNVPPNIPAGSPRSYAQENLPEYYGMIEEIDQEFGRIMKALDASGAAENTIVIFTSDHGDMIGSQGLEHKNWPHEESARTPLLVRFPKSVKAGQVIIAPIGAPDLYPTMAGLAGVTAPPGLDGFDFSPVITGKSMKPPRDYVYLSKVYGYVPWPGWRAIRTDRYMYARIKDRPWLLFDLKKDPWEMNNLVDDPASKDLVKQFDERLMAVMKETGDSWDTASAKGGREKWSDKKQDEYLGYDWPGRIESPADGEDSHPEKKKKNRKVKKQL